MILVPETVLNIEHFHCKPLYKSILLFEIDTIYRINKGVELKYILMFS